MTAAEFFLALLDHMRTRARTLGIRLTTSRNFFLVIDEVAGGSALVSYSGNTAITVSKGTIAGEKPAIAWAWLEGEPWPPLPQAVDSILAALRNN